MTQNLFERIERWLHERQVDFDVLRHKPVYTSAEAAEVRGAALASGAKALVCKADGRFMMFVLPADRKLASKQIRAERKWKSLRFANRDELVELTGLEPGSVPPFGSLFDLPTLCDRRLGDQQRINFNAGDHTISLSMTFDDYVAVERPELGLFAD